MTVDLFFLAILCSIGLIVTYEDIKIGKVRNKFILIGLIGGLLGYLLLAIQSLFISGIEVIYFSKVLINIFLSWTIACFIWYFGFWSAGDAKLFMLFAFLFPLKYYGDNLPISFLPSFILLVNTFVFALIFLVIEVFLKIIMIFFNLTLDFNKLKFKENLTKLLNKCKNKIYDNMANYLKIFLAYFSFFTIFYIIKLYLLSDKIATTIPFLGKFDYIIMILFFKPLKFFLSRTKTVYLLILNLLICILLIVNIPPKEYFLQLSNICVGFGGFMLIFLIVRKIVVLYIQKKETLTIDINKISPHMVLSDETVKRINKYMNGSGIKEKFYSDGLTVKQVDYLKDLSYKNRDFNEITVYRTFPFAPFIFLGTTATIFLKGIVFDHPLVASILKMLMGKSM